MLNTTYGKEDILALLYPGKYPTIPVCATEEEADKWYCADGERRTE